MITSSADPMPISDLADALDDICDDTTEAVIIITVNATQIRVSTFGERRLVVEALQDAAEAVTNQA